MGKLQLLHEHHGPLGVARSYRHSSGRRAIVVRRWDNSGAVLYVLFPRVANPAFRSSGIVSAVTSRSHRPHQALKIAAAQKGTMVTEIMGCTVVQALKKHAKDKD